VQKLLGIKRVSMGTLSESAGVFDPAPLQDIIRELAGRAVPLSSGREAEALQGLTAVDGSVLKALPRMAWALWQDEQHRGVKLHLHFDVLAGTPRQATGDRRRSHRQRARKRPNSRPRWNRADYT
jgi:hypothetical protein